MKKFLLVAVFAFALIGCKYCDCDEKESATSKEVLPLTEYSTDVQNIVLSDESIFRGIEVGLSKSEIKKETAALENEEEDYAYFQGDLNEIEFYDIEYFMVEDTIVSIEMEIYSATDKRTPQILLQMEDYFNNKFGEALEGLNGYKIWNTQNSLGETVAVGLRFEIPLIEDGVSRVQIKVELSDW